MQMSRHEFELRYRADADPWNYDGSAYEREKYSATLEACGCGPFSCALELGASIGAFSSLLAPRCERLVTLDFAPTAVDAARRRLAAFPQVELVLGRIPEAVPAYCYDLVVCSEILYYLQPGELDATLATLRSCLHTGGRLVSVHWRPGGPERPLSAEQVHRRLAEQEWLVSVGSWPTADYLLDVLAKR